MQPPQNRLRLLDKARLLFYPFSFFVERYTEAYLAQLPTMHLSSLKPLVWLMYLLVFFEGLGAGAFIASFSTRAEPQITPPPAVKILNVRDDSQGQNFIGYYYFDSGCLLIPASLGLALSLPLMARRHLEATC
jgi:hypothetical protein